MKVGLCAFSGFKIYPGHGVLAVRSDGKTHLFINKKARRSFFMKRNPREISWTVLYRRKHKKGQDEESVKKRNRRTQKFQRAIVGASLADIMAKKNMKPEVRKAQREQAIKVAKEKNRAQKAAKQKTAPVTKAKQTKQKMKLPKAKSVPKQSVRVGGKR